LCGGRKIKQKECYDETKYEALLNLCGGRKIKQKECYDETKYEAET